jgi:hypothetical protein
MRKCALLLLVLLAAVFAATPAPAGAASRHFTAKKAIWGPVIYNGKSQFPIYHDLGAGIWHSALDWDTVAPSKPANPRDPADPAYNWPPELDMAEREAAKYKIRIAIQLRKAPGWANGGRAPEWAPKHASDFANFATAAARRYPSVRLWMIWGEPSRRDNFMPLTPEKQGSTRLTRKQAAAPRKYAQILDASYAALKKVRRSNLVIGGNTFTAGDITPYNWVHYMRLPNGKPPRMDLYGHNAFTGRPPKTRRLYHSQIVDFSDLPKFEHYLDSQVRAPGGRKLRIFISEFFWPTDHANGEFGFHLDPSTQASWLSQALARAESSKRIYSLAWYSLYDDPPMANGMEVNRGLLRRSGKKKPAYAAFRRG